MNCSLRVRAITAILLVGISCNSKNDKKGETEPTFLPSTASFNSLIGPTKDNVISYLPARAGKTDWGLALSGGGIRSATYSIGVMKALYDLGVLDSLDVISSVSGGGYASYWLYTNYQQRSSGVGRFGATAFSDDVFIQNLCQLQVSGRFVPVSAALRSVVDVSSGRASRAFDDYEQAIWRVFSNGAAQQGNLASARLLVDDKKAPFFILNTTVTGTDVKKVSQRNLLENTLALTPAYFGNQKVGTHPWSDLSPCLVRWSEAVTMSAAALSPLRHHMNYKTPTGQQESVLLYDGGRSENLAALNLIQQGLKNIIIVDAAQDSDYTFEAYNQLRKLLRPLGYEFNVPAIDLVAENPSRSIRKREKMRAKYHRLGQSVYLGYARPIAQDTDKTGALTSTVYYIKMALPTSLENKIRNIAAFDKGKSLALRRDQLKRRGCQALATFPFQQDLFTYKVSRYSQDIAQRFRSRTTSFAPSVFRLGFPQTTTADQDFKADQLEAFVGLGYLQGIELKKHFPAKGIAANSRPSPGVQLVSSEP